MREEDTPRRNISQKGRGNGAYYILIEQNCVGGSLSVQTCCPTHSLADSDRTNWQGERILPISIGNKERQSCKYYEFFLTVAFHQNKKLRIVSLSPITLCCTEHMWSKIHLLILVSINPLGFDDYFFPPRFVEMACTKAKTVWRVMDF